MRAPRASTHQQYWPGMDYGRDCLWACGWLPQQAGAWGDEMTSAWPIARQRPTLGERRKRVEGEIEKKDMRFLWFKVWEARAVWIGWWLIAAGLLRLHIWLNGLSILPVNTGLPCKNCKCLSFRFHLNESSSPLPKSCARTTRRASKNSKHHLHPS